MSAEFQTKKVQNTLLLTTACMLLSAPAIAGLTINPFPMGNAGEESVPLEYAPQAVPDNTDAQLPPTSILRPPSASVEVPSADSAYFDEPDQVEPVQKMVVETVNIPPPAMPEAEIVTFNEPEIVEPAFQPIVEPEVVYFDTPRVAPRAVFAHAADHPEYAMIETFIPKPRPIEGIAQTTEPAIEKIAMVETNAPEPSQADITFLEPLEAPEPPAIEEPLVASIQTSVETQESEYIPPQAAPMSVPAQSYETAALDTALAAIEPALPSEEDIQTQISAEPVGMEVLREATNDSNNDSVFEAYEGQSMRATLQKWSKKSNVNMIWNNQNEFGVLDNLNSFTSYAEAVKNLLDQYQGDSVRPVARLHVDNTSGQMTLVVDVENELL